MAYNELDGFKQAAETYTSLYQNQTQRLQQQAQQQYYEDRVRLEEEEREAAKREKEGLAYEKWKTDNLLKNAYDKIYGQNLIKQGISGDRAIAEKTKQVGIELLKTNPSVGLKLIEQGNEQLKNSSNAEQEVLKTEVARKEYAAKILTGVQDGEGWENAKVSLSNMGFPIPPQFMQYNDNTKKWIATQVVGSKASLDEEKLDLKRRELESKEEAWKAKQELAEQKEARIARNQAWTQQMREIGYKTGKPASPKETQLVLKELSGDERFSDLPKESQLEAAKDLDYVARGIQFANPQLAFDQARDQAKKMILDNIVDGEYKSNTSGGGVINTAPPAAIEALKKNPALKDQFFKKYKYLPEGI